MSTRNSPYATGNLRDARRVLFSGAALLTLFGLFRTTSLDAFAAYLLITSATLLPAALWLRVGAPGIPVLPVVAAFHWLYYGVPILRANVGGTDYAPADVLQAAATVALFLLAATAAWRIVLGASSRRTEHQPASVGPGRLMIRLMFVGLSIGIMFQLAVLSGWLSFLGSFFGVVRAVSLSIASIACYIMGHTRARGLLRGQHWTGAVTALAALIVLSWSSLFLVGGLEFALAAVLGYSITAKRIPWVPLLPMFAIVFVLHAGKAQMRDQYWPGGYSQDIPVSRIPGVMTEWVADGVQAIISGEVNQDVIDRAALLYMLLNVQRLTPDTIPYLGGETYALLPTYLMPRFLDPNKPASQAGLALLNIRYGIQTPESNQFTTIGWGVIAEAFANFGYVGVLGIGILFGVLTGLFTRWSIGAPALSLTALISIMALMTLTNLEADFGYMLVNLWQTIVTTLMFFVPIRMLAIESGPSRGRPASPSARLQPL